MSDSTGRRGFGGDYRISPCIRRPCLLQKLVWVHHVRGYELTIVSIGHWFRRTEAMGASCAGAPCTWVNTARDQKNVVDQQSSCHVFAQCLSGTL